MSLSPLELKNQGNQHYSNNRSSLAIQSYTEAIKLLQIHPEDDVPLYVLYSNRAAAYIQDEDFYGGYEDAKESLKLKKDENFKGFYRAAICAFHLGFLDKSKELINAATEDHHQNLLDYLNLKLMIEKKIKCMTKWRKPVATAKKCLKNLEQIITQGTVLFEIPAILYQIRYLLRAFFEESKDQKMMNVDHGDLGLRLHELAVQFNLIYPVDKLIQADPMFEDLILNEMPDVGSSRLKAYRQRHLPEDKQDDDLDEMAEDDLTAYEFSFFVNNILASLVVHSSDERISSRALKQIHRLTTIDLYRDALGDSLSDAINNYIYLNYENVPLVENFFSNCGIEILFHDYIEASCELSALRMIKQMTIGHWKKQSLSTIEFVLKQISKKLGNEGIELIEPKSSSRFVSELKELINLYETDDQTNEKRDFHLIVNVLTKISFVFGEEPFVHRSTDDPFFLFVKQIWFDQMNSEQNQHDISFLLDAWSSIITKWFKLDYPTRRQYIQQIHPQQLSLTNHQ